MFRTRNNYPTSPSQHIEYGTPKLTVIDGEGRSYVKHLDKGEYIKYSLQDDDRTLKVIVKS